MIKIIAAVLMLVDHIGMVFFPNHFVLRIIGRLSMPLFAYCIAQGFSRTSSFEKYFKRMGLFAVISQIPFWMMMYVTYQRPFEWMHFNIGFTFLGGLLALDLYKGLKINTNSNKTLNVLGILMILVITTVMKCDYGAYGILLVLTFYECYIIREDALLTFSMLPAATSILLFIGHSDQFRTQLWGILAFFIIILFKDVPFRRVKYFFYIFYPFHMFILSVIKGLQ